MLVINIAGYKFIPLTDLTALRETFLQQCQAMQLKGTILLSAEGININLAGPVNNILSFKEFLTTDARFADISFHEGESAFVPFKHLKIKIKKEIITMGVPTVKPETGRAPSIAPQEFKQWLDEGRDIVVLDTRNDFEVRFGAFKNALNPQIDSFTEFTKLSETLDPSKPIVMYCTGGIRCEKAALHLLQKGFTEVYQLHTGILGYFKEVGKAHYEGDCFVFDERIAVDENLAVAKVSS